MRSPKLGICMTAAALSLAAAPISAVPAMAAAGTATVTIVHGIPNTPVDVYANGKKILSITPDSRAPDAPARSA